MITSNGPIELKEDYIDDQSEQKDEPEKEQTAWQKHKKAVILFLIAGPKASLIMAPIMIKKLLAKYSITITGTMLAYTAIKLCMTTGIYLLYKSH